MPRRSLISPDLRAPLLLNGSAGTDGQMMVSRGPGQPPEYRAAPVLNLKHFGAVGDNITPDDAAVAAWLAAVISTGGAGYVPTGIYKLDQPLFIDLATCRGTGIRLWGDGPGRSLFWSTVTETTGIPFKLSSTGTEFTNYFYTSIDGIGFRGRTNGVCFALGEDTTEGNGCNFRNIRINNSSPGANAKACVISSFYASSFTNLTVNCGGEQGVPSISVELRRSSFCNFTSCAFGQAYYALAMTGDAVQLGNTFVSNDYETCNYAILINSTSARNNTFIGSIINSAFGDRSYCVNAIAGRDTIFLNPFFGGYTVAPFENKVGVIWVNGSDVTTDETYRFLGPNLSMINCGTSSPAFQVYHAEGTEDDPTAVTAARASQIFQSYAHDGSTYRLNARLDFWNVGAVTPTSSPGEFRHYTTPTNSTTPVLRHRITQAGNTIPGADNAYTLGQNGARWSAVWAATGTIQTSDARAKTDIRPLPVGLDFIRALEPVAFRFKVGGQRILGQAYQDADGNPVTPDDPDFDKATPGEVITEPVPGRREHWGQLAQHVKTVCDRFGVDSAAWVQSDMDDPDSEQGLRETQFIAPLIKAVQELAAKVEQLEARWPT